LKDKLFDLNRPYRIVEKWSRKTCTVRFPADGEWIEYASQNSLVRSVGHSLFAGNLESPDAVRALFEKIKTQESAPFDVAGMGKVIETLRHAVVSGVEHAGLHLTISISVAGAEVKHILRLPSTDEMRRSRLLAFLAGEPAAPEELLRDSAAVWAELEKGVDGYADPQTVPVIHKYRALAEVFLQAQAALIHAQATW
jgi:hypothetical protein